MHRLAASRLGSHVHRAHRPARPAWPAVVPRADWQHHRTVGRSSARDAHASASPGLVCARRHLSTSAGRLAHAAVVPEPGDGQQLDPGRRQEGVHVGRRRIPLALAAAMPDLHAVQPLRHRPRRLRGARLCLAAAIPVAETVVVDGPLDRRVQRFLQVGSGRLLASSEPDHARIASASVRLARPAATPRRNGPVSSSSQTGQQCVVFQSSVDLVRPEPSSPAAIFHVRASSQGRADSSPRRQTANNAIAKSYASQRQRRTSSVAISDEISPWHAKEPPTTKLGPHLRLSSHHVRRTGFFPYARRTGRGIRTGE